MLAGVGLVAAWFVYNTQAEVNDQLEQTKVKQVRTDLHTIGNCLDLYRVDKGRYPATLLALVDAGKCKAGITDPWGREYVYLYPGRVHPDAYDIMSYGSDGQPGGEGPAADIVMQ